MTCKLCGTNFADGAKFCPSCGAPVEADANNNTNNMDFSAKLASLNNTEDTTSSFSNDDILNNKVMAILAYFGILVLIPLFAAKDSKFARFHTNQGLVLFLAIIAYGIVASIAGSIIAAISWNLYFILSTVLNLVYLVFGVLAIIGIINAAKGRAKKLPVIGGITLLK